MNKNYFILGIILISTIAIVVVTAMKTQIEMQNIAGTEATGVVQIREDMLEGNLDMVKVSVRVSHLPTPQGKVFEGWFVDIDTGYKLSLGGFTTNTHGEANFVFKQTLVNLPLYDKIVITEEPAGDTNPNPDAPILIADLP